MKKNNKIIYISVFLVILIVAGIRSLWDIDISMGVALTGGQLMTLTGSVPLNVFYHKALIMNLMSYVALGIISFVCASLYLGADDDL
jgi:hypothetical protein